MGRPGNVKPREGRSTGGRGQGVVAPSPGEERARAWARQQQALASLGQAALRSPDVDTLLAEAARRDRHSVCQPLLVGTQCPGGAWQ